MKSIGITSNEELNNRLCINHLNSKDNFEVEKMYICCFNCRHRTHVRHQQGHGCNYHDCWIDYNDYESAKLMYECKNCELSLPKVLELARLCKSISFEYVFDEHFHVMNDIGAYVKDEKEFNRGFVKDPLKAFGVHKVKNNHVIGYRILFNGFPVYYCERIEEIHLIMEGLGLKK